MVTRSQMAKVQPSLVLFPQTITATTTTTGIDTAEYDSLAILFALGTMAFTGTDSLTITIEHSDNNSDWSVVGAEDLASAETPASGIFKVLDAGTEDESLFVCDYIGSKRYVRAVLTEAGTVSVALAVIANNGHPKAMPTR